MPDSTPVVMLDDIEDINRTAEFDRIAFAMVFEGEKRYVAMPTEAAAKLWIGLADAFRRDGRTLQERRSLVPEQNPHTVELLAAEDILVRAPDTERSISSIVTTRWGTGRGCRPSASCDEEARVRVLGIYRFL
jgi:hypothetical protein